jgi:hypothetical protein
MTRASAGMTIAANPGQYQLLSGGRARWPGLAACACSASTFSADTACSASAIVGWSSAWYWAGVPNEP